MRLEKQRQAELAQRQGSTKRTVMQIIWFLIALAIGFAAATILFNEGLIDKQVITRELPAFIKGRDIRDYVATGMITFALALVVQFFVQMGFLIASPQGRRKTGHASAMAQTEDPLENNF